MARLSWILGVSLLGAALADPALAQSIVPDGTLGPEQSLLHTGMLGSIEIEQIEGGATRGPNLFHSFEAFGVEAGKAVYFANPMGIGRIFGRVTGSAASRIDGTLGVLGQADLFLLNPNGVLFGPGARLDLSGSFLASTAESFEFGGGLQFNAVNPQPAPLLNIALRPGLQHGLGDVVNEGELRVSTGESLTLIGNTARNQGLLAAPGGNIALLGNLVSLKDGSTVDVSSLSGGGQVFIGGAFQGQGITPRATRTFVGPEAMIKADAISQGNGGEVIVWADQDTRFYGQVSAQGGATGGNGGLVEVSGKDALQYDGRVNTAAANGIGGRLLLDPTNIEVVGFLQFGTLDLSTVDEFSDPNLNGDRTQVSALAINQSNSDVVLQATNDIDIQSPIMLRRGVSFTAEAGGSIRMGESLTFLPGLGANGIQAEEGNISLTAGADISLEKSVIRSDSSSAQNSGDINLLSNRFILGDAGQVASLVSISSTGNAGNIRIEANEILLMPTGPAGGLIMTKNRGAGQAGSIDMEAERLVLRNGVEINSTTNGTGDAGKIRLMANSVLLGDEFDSNLIIAANLPGSTGKSGSVQITATERVSLLGETSIYAGTFNNQNGGLIEVGAPEIELSGFPNRQSSISTEVIAADTLNTAGSAGQIKISAERLTVRDNALINASSRLTNGGDIEINATEDIILSNQGLIVSLGNQGGNIRVEAGSLNLANRSGIQSVGLGSDAGDVNIQVQRGLRLTGGSQIVSNSLEGTGGQVSVTAGNIDIREASIIGSTTLTGDRAGSLNISAQESITLDQGLIQTTSFSGGGNIVVTTQNGDLRLQQSSGIVTSSIGESDTGNVTLEIAGDIVGSGISLISTSSFSTGASGAINIDARSLNLSQASQVATAVIDPSTFDFSPALLDITETLGTEVAQLFEEAFAPGC
ncbi:MAG: filamentous hemagglutinin N-terminal domain-containing protein [Synechococcales cyanobacterium RM1_1_8]|nr:filamentous hemagglutinin N-terminal domain-containing protein [Synechococcales cyanobacterium RM1_1_8]